MEWAHVITSRTAVDARVFVTDRMRPLRQDARAERGAHDAAPYAASRHHRPHAPRRLRRPDRKSDAHAHSTTDGITGTRDSGALSARRQRAVARRTMTGFYLTVDGRSAGCHGERQFAIAELAGRPSTGAAPFGRCRARCEEWLWRQRAGGLAGTWPIREGVAAAAPFGAGGAGVADDFAPAIALARLKLRSSSSIFHLARSPDARDPPHPRHVCHAAWLACEEVPLVPFPADRMSARPVSRFVNKAGNEGAECIGQP